MPVIRKTLGSSSLVHAPGVIRWARNGYRTASEEEKARFVDTLKCWDLPEEEALYILKCDTKSLTWDEKAGRVAFRPIRGALMRFTVLVDYAEGGNDSFDYERLDEALAKHHKETKLLGTVHSTIIHADEHQEIELYSAPGPMADEPIDRMALPSDSGTYGTM